MLDRFLGFTRWQAFMRTGLLYLIGWLIAKLGAVFLLASWPGASSLMLVGSVLQLLGVAFGLVWFFAVIFSLRKIREVQVDGRFVVGIAAFSVFTYHALYVLGALFYIKGGGVVPGDLNVFNGQFTWFAFASMVLLAYKAAVSLESAEGIKKLGSDQKWTNAILFLFQPIGVWWLQPRIQKAALKSDELGIEDHLTVD